MPLAYRRDRLFDFFAGFALGALAVFLRVVCLRVGRDAALGAFRDLADDVLEEVRIAGEGAWGRLTDRCDTRVDFGAVLGADF